MVCSRQGRVLPGFGRSFQYKGRTYNRTASHGRQRARDVLGSSLRSLNFFSKDETMKRALILALALAGVLSGVTHAAHAQDAERGSRKVAMCEGCHQIVGYQTGFPKVYKVPMIAGQDAKYIASALKAYRA